MSMVSGSADKRIIKKEIDLKEVSRLENQYSALVDKISESE